jgi:transcriptional regulator with XRE-family HTH domain
VSINGKIVRSLRITSNLTRGQLAERAKLSASAIQDIETQPPKKRRKLTVMRLAAGLGVHPETLTAE